MSADTVAQGSRPAAAGDGKRQQARALSVLFAVSEAYPLVKTGGLADVGGYLPRALQELRQDVRIILPAYQSVLDDCPGLRPVTGFTGGEGIRLLEGVLPGSDVPVYLLDAPGLFDRRGDPYTSPDGGDWPDNDRRFGLFNRVITRICLGRAGLSWRPQVLHCNDWQTGLAPALLSGHAGRPTMIFTVHSMAYLGLFPGAAFETLSIPPSLRSYQALEYYGQLSFIKGGLVFADRITTVSPSYAREITTPAFGNGLDGLLRHRTGDLCGILNGVDYHDWDPRRDPMIEHHYWTDSPAMKGRNKTDLQAKLGLAQDRDAVLLAQVGRLIEQKGIDLTLAILPRLLREENVQLVILGSGDRRHEQEVARLAEAWPGRVAVQTGFHEALAHRIIAAADLLLMPSRFEPCGLTQLYALRYGTIPVVHSTGGLIDTVVDTSEATLAAGTATGFQFTPCTAVDYLSTVTRALQLYRTRRQQWRRIMLTAMERDFSWKDSARRYDELYRQALHAGRDAN